MVGAGAATSGAGAQASSGCVTLPSGQCVDAKACASGERRDVVVDSSGKVVAVVCYPGDSAPPVIDAQGDVNLDKNQNNGVVALDGNADGVDIAGNVTATGNNVTVYGHGADVPLEGEDLGRARRPPRRSLRSPHCPWKAASGAAGGTAWGSPLGEAAPWEAAPWEAAASVAAASEGAT